MIVLCDGFSFQTALIFVYFHFTVTELKKEEADIKVEVGLERREQISSETSSTMSNDVTANIFENTCVSSEEETKIEESEVCFIYCYLLLLGFLCIDF